MDDTAERWSPPPGATILGISGRKKSGKSTLADAVTAAAAVPVSRLAFADPIKEFAVHVLGVPRERVYGTDEDKNGPSGYRWRDLPHFERVLADWRRRGLSDEEVAARSSEQMSVRHLLQEVGTGVLRSFAASVPIDVLFRRMRAVVAADGRPRLFVVDDVRFPNEMEAVRGANGLLIRLERCGHLDEHVSETCLDNADGWDLRVDNRETSAAEAAAAALRLLAGRGVPLKAAAEGGRP